MYDIAKIKKDAMLSRSNMERIGKAYASLAKESGDHAGDVETAAKDIGQLQADFNAIKDITKNSDNTSQTGEKQVVTGAEVGTLKVTAETAPPVSH